jgi:hypothetical protein
LVREKYFCLRPKPLERWLWQQGLPQAAERVFWLHWEEGMRSATGARRSRSARGQQCCVDVLHGHARLPAAQISRVDSLGSDSAAHSRSGRAIRLPTRLFSRPRPSPRCSLFTLARARQQIAQLIAPSDAQEILRQVVWAIEEGALRRFEIPLALNIALKKIRQQGWTRPHRMPPNWVRFNAAAETCNAA